MEYIELSNIFKVLANPKRLEILDLLSCGEMCACKINELFNITQPTLSYDMKLLKEIEFVVERQEGRNKLYKLNEEKIVEIKTIFDLLTKNKPNCVCKREKTGSCTKKEECNKKEKVNCTENKKEKNC